MSARSDETACAANLTAGYYYVNVEFAVPCLYDMTIAVAADWGSLGLWVWNAGVWNRNSLVNPENIIAKYQGPGDGPEKEPVPSWKRGVSPESSGSSTLNSRR